MKRLMDVTDEMSDEPQRNQSFITRCLTRAENAQIPRYRFNDAVALFAVALLIVCVRLFWEVDEVIPVHVGNPGGQRDPARWRRQLTWCLAEQLFDTVEGSVSQVSLGDSGNDLMPFTAPRGLRVFSEKTTVWQSAVRKMGQITDTASFKHAYRIIECCRNTAVLLRGRTLTCEVLHLAHALRIEPEDFYADVNDLEVGNGV